MQAVDVDTATSKKAFEQEAKEQGFYQFVTTMSKTLFAMPAAWVVIFLLSYQKVPVLNLLVWISAFFVFWVVALVVLRTCRDAERSMKKHLIPVGTVVVAEGLLLGSLLFVLMGYDIEIDAWAVVFVIGILSIVLPTYITYPKAFHLLLLSVWTAASVSVLMISHRFDIQGKVILTLLIYLAALAYIIRPISIRVIEGIRLHLENEKLLGQLTESLEIVSHQANTDALTGLLNRHALNQLLSEQIIAGERRRTAFSLLMMDVDFFKTINDTYGHDVGDLALQHVASVISSQVRDGGQCARFGGEEFVVLLPATDTAEAMVVAERIRVAIEGAPLKKPVHGITVSIGVATYHSGMTADELLKAADNEVYTAKENGRNQVRVARNLNNTTSKKEH